MPTTPFADPARAYAYALGAPYHVTAGVPVRRHRAGRQRSRQAAPEARLGHREPRGPRRAALLARLRGPPPSQRPSGALLQPALPARCRSAARGVQGRHPRGRRGRRDRRRAALAPRRRAGRPARPSLRAAPRVRCRTGRHADARGAAVRMARPRTRPGPTSSSWPARRNAAIAPGRTTPPTSCCRARPGRARIPRMPSTRSYPSSCRPRTARGGACPGTNRACACPRRYGRRAGTGRYGTWNG